MPVNQNSDQYSRVKFCSNEQWRKIFQENRCGYFAYTGGVYNAQSIEAVKKASFEAAFAVSPKNLSINPLYELPRTDIYSPSIMKLELKIFGLPSLLQRFGLRRD